MKQNIQTVTCIYNLVFKSKDILCQWRQLLLMNSSNCRLLVQCNPSWLGIWIRTQKFKACLNYRMSSNWYWILSKTLNQNIKYMLFWECRLVVWYKGCTRLPISSSYWKYISQLWDLSKQVPHRLIYLNTLSSVGGIAVRDHRTIRRWRLMERASQVVGFEY